MGTSVDRGDVLKRTEYSLSIYPQTFDADKNLFQNSQASDGKTSFGVQIELTTFEREVLTEASMTVSVTDEGRVAERSSPFGHKVDESRARWGKVD